LTGTSKRLSGRHPGEHGRRLGWASRAAIAVTAAGTIAAGGAGVASTAMASTGVASTHAASTRAHPAPAGKTAVVAHKRSRPKFGSMLVTAKAGRALYILPTGPCAGECLAVWPRLLMPKGTTTPLGTSCLGTAKVGKTGRLQVTYGGRRVYTFVDDHGHSVTGNGVSGFKVAKAVHCQSTVVKQRARGKFGTILVAAKQPLSGRALYTLPHGTCTGACLTAWPRLALPKGKTLPLGAHCLSTAKFGKNGLQVTYRGHRLYLFQHDSGHSVKGNGVAGFKVAKVAAHC
jgi:predicted lipoprotein with Yx(FWY)xxD motif